MQNQNSFDKSYYSNEHEDILAQYREKYKGRSSYLFEDGIIDPSNYRGVLFLLKEAYSKEQRFGEWNLASKEYLLHSKS